MRIKLRIKAISASSSASVELESFFRLDRSKSKVLSNMKVLVVLAVCVFFAGAYGASVDLYDGPISGHGKLMNQLEFYLSPQFPCKM